MSPQTSPPTGWADRFRADPGRALVQLVAGLLAAALAYIALIVATLSWCIPDSCDRSLAGVVIGSVVFAGTAAGALRWLSLGRLAWSRAAFVGGAMAVFLNGYEIVEQLLL